MNRANLKTISARNECRKIVQKSAQPRYIMCWISCFFTFICIYSLCTILILSCFDFQDKTLVLYEEFISILIFICAEKYTQGIADVTIEEIARREVIHQLAPGAKPHSRIQKYLPEEVNEVSLCFFVICCSAEESFWWLQMSWCGC